MFDDVYSAVSHPDTLSQRKAQIDKTLKTQRIWIGRILNNQKRAEGVRSRQDIIPAYKTAQNDSTISKRRFLQSARAERSHMNMIKANASAIHHKQLAKKRLQSARVKSAVKVRKPKAN